MRVLLNMLPASGKKTGIGHYVSELFQHLLQIAGEEQIDSFPRPWLRFGWRMGNQLRPHLERLKPRRTSSTASDSASPAQASVVMTFLRQWGQKAVTGHLAKMCRRNRYDVYHEPNLVPLPCDVKTIGTVHDLSCLLHPQWHPKDRTLWFEKHCRRALEQCVHFVAVSDFSRREFMDTFNISPDSITRMYNGIRSDLAPLPQNEIAAALQRLALPPQYLLYLGTLEPRKNVLMLLQVYCSLPESFRRRWPLLLVGSWGWNTTEIRNYFHERARHCGVIHLGYVADEHLKFLYNGARVLLYPSFYEGFGLPPVEMLACGGAVLASTAGAVAETAGHKAHLLDPEDRDGWRQAIQRVTSEDDWWQALRDGAAESVRHFTWEQCAAQTLRVYRRVTHGNMPDEKIISTPRLAS